jgi:hypothetical protein
MTRVQVNLSAAQLLELRRRSAESGLSVAEMVREAVGLWLEQDERRLRVDRAIASIGGFRSGLGDLAENHDQYLDDAAGP